MRERFSRQVDVFTATPYLGNPLAVVSDTSGTTCVGSASVSCISGTVLL